MIIEYNGGVAEKYNTKRAFLPRGEQRILMDKILRSISVSEAADLCDLSERTVRDWRREKLSMSYDAIRRLCREAGISVPSNLELRERYWYVAKGARAGAVATLQKYGGRLPIDEEYRKKRWKEWWHKKGKHGRVWKRLSKSKSIRTPNYSKDLAEFVGIMLGDGGIAQYQVAITLHIADDKEYGKFVVRLLERLFKVPVSIYPNRKDSVCSYVISRVALVRFCVDHLGLKQGNKVKQQADIPDWVKRSKEYSIACVRGLVDTDGSVFTHRYKVNGKEYQYKKLAFTSASKPLLYSVAKILQDIGLNTRIAQKRDVRIDSISDMKRYFEVVGSHNPKHLKRYKN